MEKGAPAKWRGGGNYHNMVAAAELTCKRDGNWRRQFGFVGCTGNFKGLGGKSLAVWSGQKFCRWWWWSRAF